MYLFVKTSVMIQEIKERCCVTHLMIYGLGGRYQAFLRQKSPVQESFLFFCCQVQNRKVEAS